MNYSFFRFSNFGFWISNSILAVQAFSLQVIHIGYWFQMEGFQFRCWPLLCQSLRTLFSYKAVAPHIVGCSLKRLCEQRLTCFCLKCVFTLTLDCTFHYTFYVSFRYWLPKRLVCDWGSYKTERLPAPTAYTRWPACLCSWSTHEPRPGLHLRLHLLLNIVIDTSLSLHSNTVTFLFLHTGIMQMDRQHFLSVWGIT